MGDPREEGFLEFCLSFFIVRGFGVFVGVGGFFLNLGF